MAPSQLDAVRDLEDQFAEAMTRMYAVGNGLAAMRQQLVAESSPAAGASPEWAGPAVAVPDPSVRAATSGPSTGAGSAGPSSVPGESESSRPTTNGESPSAAPSMFPGTPANHAPARDPWWQREGMIVRVLGIVGAGVLLIGVAMLLVYAVQHGLIGPVGRVAGAGVLAVGLVLTAHRIHRDPQRRPASIAIAAAGYATAYLDVMAATIIYEWLPPAAGFALAAVIAGSGIVLARAWDQQLLAAISIGGVAVLGPVIGDGATELSAAFLVILAVASYPVHIGKNWTALHAVRILPAAGAVVAALGDGPDTPLLLALGAVLAAFDLGTSVIASRVNRPLLPPVLLASAMALGAVSDAKVLEGWLVLAAAAIAYLLAATMTGRDAHRPGILRTAPWAGMIGTLFVLAAVAKVFPNHWDETGFALTALVYAGAAMLTRTLWVRVVAIALGVGALLAYLPTLGPVLDKTLAVATFDASSVVESALTLGVVLVLIPLAKDTLATLAVGSRASAAVGVSAAGGPVRNPSPVSPDFAPAPGLAASGADPFAVLRRALPFVFWPFLLLAGSGLVISAAVVIGARRDTDAAAAGFVAGHGVATLLWAIGAAYLLRHGLGRARDASRALPIGLGLAAVAVGKLLLFDIAALDGIVRIAAFIGAGLLLLAMGTGYARALERARPGTPPAGPA